MTSGRSIPEFQRLVTSPQDVTAAEVRMNEGYGCTDWYFCKKSL